VLFNSLAEAFGLTSLNFLFKGIKLQS